MAFEALHLSSRNLGITFCCINIAMLLCTPWWELGKASDGQQPWSRLALCLLCGDALYHPQLHRSLIKWPDSKQPFPKQKILKFRKPHVPSLSIIILSIHHGPVQGTPCLGKVFPHHPARMNGSFLWAPTGISWRTGKEWMPNCVETSRDRSHTKKKYQVV